MYYIVNYTWVSLKMLSLPLAVPSTVETHTEKSLRSIGAVMSGAVITTQYCESTPSITVRFLGSSIPTLTPVQ